MEALRAAAIVLFKCPILFKSGNSYTSFTDNETPPFLLLLLPFQLLLLLLLHLLSEYMLRNHAGSLLQLSQEGGSWIECFLTLSVSGAKELPRVRTMREQSRITLIILSKNAQKKTESQTCPDFPAGTQLGKSIGSGQAS